MNIPIMTESPEDRRLRRVRLNWRWKDSGITGSGPWTHRMDVVEAWFESMSRRSGERVEHWIEVQEIDAAEPSAPDREMRESDRTPDARTVG